MRKLTLLALLSSLTTASAQPVADPYSKFQWGLTNDGSAFQEEITDIESIQRKGLAGADIGYKGVQALEAKLKKTPVVAVFDFGVDYDHKDIVDQIYRNDAECSDGKITMGEAKEDKDGNGYKGDCMGINLTTRNPLFKNRPQDDNGHGTHVAGIIAATRNNGLGISGVSSRIKILPIKVLSSEREAAPKGEVPKMTSDLVAEGIMYAIKRKVDVINMSMGWPLSQNTELVQTAIRAALEQGIVVVAAAGNNNNSAPIYPCAQQGVLCVGALEQDGSMSGFSNFGGYVDILAPGSNILSTFPSTLIPSFFSAQGYEYKSGTSQAAPFVAAAAALVKGALPNASPAEIRNRLLDATQPSSERNKFVSGGFMKLDLLAQKLSQGVVAPARPVFKGKDYVTVDGATLRIDYRIPIDGTAAAGAVQLQSLNPDIRVISAQRSAKEIHVVAQAASRRAHSDWKFKLNFNGREYTHQIQLAMNRNRAGKMQIALPPGVKANGFQSITSYDPRLQIKSPTQDYYSTVRTKDGIELTFWQLALPNGFTKLFTKVIGNSRQVMRVFRIDLNDDKKQDYLIYTYSKGADEKTGEEVYKEFSAYYLASNGQGLFTADGFITPTDTEPRFAFTALQDIYRTAFIKFTLSNGKKIMVPSLVQNGFMPDLDASREDRRKPSIKTHIYYLQPVESKDGLQFTTRVADSSTVQEDIRAKLNLSYYEKVDPIFTNFDPTNTNDGRYIVFTGQGGRNQLVQITLGENAQVTWKQVGSQYHNYPESGQFPVWNIQSTGGFSDMNNRTATLNIISSQRIESGLWNESTQGFDTLFRFTHPDRTEKFVRPIQFFEHNGVQKFIFETTTELGYMIMNGRGTPRFFTTPVNRVSFFGEIFAQVTYPVQVQTAAGAAPALYVDNSSISASTTRTWLLSDTGPIAPIDLTLEIPTNCKTLNPVNIVGKGLYYRVTCTNAGTESLELLPIQTEAR